jgi:hypothetical protein
MNAGVPTTWLTALVIVPLASNAFEMPKSMTTGPSGPIRTLPGLKSRWTTPAWWIAASAVTVLMASRSNADPRRGPSARS